MIDLRSFTPARIGLGRTGNAVPTSELLRFQLDHARARDAVHRELDPHALPFPHIVVRSQAADRTTYLRRPDLGRTLHPGSQLAKGDYDAAIVIADGLSAVAIHRHAPALIGELEPRLQRRGWRLAQHTVVLQGRVAIGDEIGHALGASLVLMLIGERPGLTSPDSLGAYLTYDPRPGRTDAERNCVSNIRPEGLPYALAAHKLEFLMVEARARRLSGVQLKEDAPPLLAQ